MNLPYNLPLSRCREIWRDIKHSQSENSITTRDLFLLYVRDEIRTRKLDGAPKQPGRYWFNGTIEMYALGRYDKFVVQGYCKVWNRGGGGVKLIADINGGSYIIDSLEGDWYIAVAPWE